MNTFLSENGTYTFISSKFGFDEGASVFTRSMCYLPYGKTILVTVVCSFLVYINIIREVLRKV